MFLSSFYFEIFLYRHPGAGRDPLRRRHLCMFLSSFYFEIFLYRHPGAGRDPLRRRHLCRRVATHIIHWIATVAFIVCARNVHRRIRGIG